MAGLTNLTLLALGDNWISDISPVAGLTNLTYLYLYGNSIWDISPVAGNQSDIPVSLRQLDIGHLDSNSLSDISPVAGLTNLTVAVTFTLGTLNSAGQRVSMRDISPVAGLTNLTLLALGDNWISDISPVAGNGLTNLTYLLSHGFGAVN